MAKASSRRASVSILVFVELAPGRGRSWSTTGCGICFNPCFCGTRARTRDYHGSGGGIIGFQSLFLWNSRPDGVGPENTHPWPCFNPCFCGTRARTRRELGEVHRRVSFQSLFLWNSRPDHHDTGRSPATHVVSILVFVELAPGQYQSHFERGVQGVSILVFVELAPGRGTPGGIGSTPGGFQSLFLWNSRPDPARTAD